MNRRKEPCRNFQRGSCQYGDRCKFLHVTQQQSKPSSFGFGNQSTSQFLQTNQQQQKPNPFGFGVSNGSQLKGASNFDANYQSPAKPFQNKWTRSSSVASANSTPSQHTDAQSQTAPHKCTDPESCKRQIVEDFKNEMPLWKLTCYGHCKNGPCDIAGDISYEELRAAAYEDAKRGLALQSIVERERNLLDSKLTEFDNLLRNPYVVSQNPNSAGMSPFPGTNNSAPLLSAQSNAPPLFSSFSQLGASTNLGLNIRTPAPGPPVSDFGLPSSSQNASQTAGVFGGQPTAEPGSSRSPNTSNFNNGAMLTGSPFSYPMVQLPQFPGSTNNHLSTFLDEPRVAANTVSQASVDALPVDNKEEVNSGDYSIWLKQEWAIGEIPIEEPPERFR